MEQEITLVAGTEYECDRDALSEQLFQCRYEANDLWACPACFEGKPTRVWFDDFDCFPQKSRRCGSYAVSFSDRKKYIIQTLSNTIFEEELESVFGEDITQLQFLAFETKGNNRCRFVGVFVKDETVFGRNEIVVGICYKKIANEFTYTLIS